MIHLQHFCSDEIEFDEYKLPDFTRSSIMILTARPNRSVREMREYMDTLPPLTFDVLKIGKYSRSILIPMMNSLRRETSDSKQTTSSHRFSINNVKMDAPLFRFKHGEELMSRLDLIKMAQDHIECSNWEESPLNVDSFEEADFIDDEFVSNIKPFVDG